MVPYNTLRCHPNMSHLEQLPQHQNRGVFIISAQFPQYKIKKGPSQVITNVAVSSVTINFPTSPRLKPWTIQNWLQLKIHLDKFYRQTVTPFQQAETHWLLY